MPSLELNFIYRMNQNYADLRCLLNIKVLTQQVEGTGTLVAYWSGECSDYTPLIFSFSWVNTSATWFIKDSQFDRLVSCFEKEDSVVDSHLSTEPSKMCSVLKPVFKFEAHFVYLQDDLNQYITVR